MLEHIAVQGVERGIVDVGGEHALAQIIEHNDARAATQPAEGLLMQFGPDLRAGPEHQQANRLAAVAQSQHEQPRAPVLAAVRVAHHRAGAVIDLSFFTGCGLDHCAGFRRLLAAKLADEAPDALVAGGEAAGVHQILPDRHGVAAMGEPEFDGVPVGPAGAGRWTAAGLRFGRRGCAAGQLRAKVGGHLTGRFCGDRLGADLEGRFRRRRVGDHFVGRFCRQAVPTAGRPKGDSSGL